VSDVVQLRPKSIEQALADAEARGQRINHWQRQTMYA
jgi:hypothetical protein